VIGSTSKKIVRLVLAAFVLAVSITPVCATEQAAAALAQPDRTKLVMPPQTLSDFSLTDQDGHSFNFNDLRGQTVLVFFGFTNCPNVCPPTLQKLRQVERSLQHEKSSLTTAFVSVDGERDTPAAMKKYLEPFEPGFIGLTGDPGAVRDIATSFSAVFFKGMPTDAVGGYNVEHTSQVYLVDREGRLRATFYNAPADDMILTTRMVMQEAH
jgi:protein SCO1